MKIFVLVKIKLLFTRKLMQFISINIIQLKAADIFEASSIVNFAQGV